MLLVFALAMFVSATLLFLIQPMFAKMVLPLLGGTPGVWNTCMVFYQAALLAGYAYAHAAPKWLGVRRQAAFHVALLILIVFTLPIGISHGWTPPTTSNPILWLLLLLTVSVGLPFLVISTTAPLLQKWFSHTGHAHAHDPYFLYGASNLGSMLALVGYPVLVEPHLRLGHQAWFWAGGYLVLTGLISMCALLLWRSAGAAGEAGPEPVVALDGAASAPPGAPPLSLSQRFWWVLLAFAPSSLLLGVTTYISTDIAAVPLLWVIPLAIYLLTFVLIFARKPLLPHRLIVTLEPYLIILVALTFFLSIKVAIWQMFPLHLLAFFLIAMVCHGELMKSRPPASQLTEFYLWLSVGGVLGGVFNALIAPIVFDSVIEYPLIIVLASLLRPNPAPAEDEPNRQTWDYLLPAAFALLLGVVGWGYRLMPSLQTNLTVLLVAGVAGALCWCFRGRPRRFALGVGVLILASLSFQTGSEQVLFQTRNFFGVLKVTQVGEYHVLSHGSTVHGIQSLDPTRRREPLSYYYNLSPLGQIFTAYAGKDAKQEVAVIGLGAGTAACYGQPGQRFTFYEIDPTVERIAQNPDYFTFLKDCPAKVEVILGDARLSLQHAPNAKYDMIILDAFSSDAIPIHLMTREALALYRAKLNKGGILVFHISNRYLDLRPVLGALARDAGWVSLWQKDYRMTIKQAVGQKSASSYVVMARELGDLARLDPGTRWQQLSENDRKFLWTDDYSNILAVFEWPAVDLREVLRNVTLR